MNFVTRTLNPKQIFFFETIARFVFDVKLLNYSFIVGEFFRPPELCELYAKEGRGILHSNHELRMAADLTGFKNGAILDYTVAAYLPLGELWEKYSTSQYQCCWGGYFTKPDVDHFSLLHNGIR